MLSLLIRRPPRQSLLTTSRRLLPVASSRSMASVNDLPQPYLTHLQRTAQQERSSDIHAVTLSKITPAAGGSIRLLHLDIDRADGVKVYCLFPPKQTRRPHTNPFDTLSSISAIVPPRSMARRAHPRHRQSRRLHHHLHPAGRTRDRAGAVPRTRGASVVCESTGGVLFPPRGGDCGEGFVCQGWRPVCVAAV